MRILALLVCAGAACTTATPSRTEVRERNHPPPAPPRPLPRPEIGDLLVLHDAGAYGYAMSSNYVSIGRAPQLYWADGRATLLSRRETIDDVMRAECNEPVP